MGFWNLTMRPQDPSDSTFMVGGTIQTRQTKTQHLQMSKTCLAHSGGDGFDGRQQWVDELCQFARWPLDLAASLHDKAGQGPDIRVKSWLIRHFGSWLCSSFWGVRRTTVPEWKGKAANRGSDQERQQTEAATRKGSNRVCVCGRPLVGEPFSFPVEGCQVLYLWGGQRGYHVTAVKTDSEGVGRACATTTACALVRSQRCVSLRKDTMLVVSTQLNTLF